MKLSKAKLRQAFVCSICAEGGDEPDLIAIVERRRGWVHALNNSRRCPGQGDDNTNDRANPVRHAGAPITLAAYLAERNGP